MAASIDASDLSVPNGGGGAESVTPLNEVFVDVSVVEVDDKPSGDAFQNGNGREAAFSVGEGVEIHDVGKFGEYKGVEDKDPGVVREAASS